MKKRLMLSTIFGMGLLAGSATGATAQNVPGESATALVGTGAATQVITLKPGQEAGTNTVMPADTAGNPIASTQDAHFVRQATAGGIAEVMMGHLAMRRGQTQSERNFGQILVTDHTRANDQLMRIAETVRLKPAEGPNAMQQAMYQKLEGAPASQFDTMFNHAMIHAHQTTIALFRAETHGGENPQLRQFAMAALPVLHKHLQVAQDLSPMTQGAGMTGMNNGMTPMRGAMAPGRTALDAPVDGNPDRSADQLNARELTSGNPS
jgi:putative membrane protein